MIIFPYFLPAVLPLAAFHAGYPRLLPINLAITSTFALLVLTLSIWRQSMGVGDGELLIVIMFCCGWQATCLIIIIAALMMIKTLISNRGPQPFVPALVSATLLVLDATICWPWLDNLCGY